MYAAGHGITQLRAPRAGGLRVRLLPALGLVVAATLGLALVAHGGSAPAESTVVVQPGDTLWSIAAAHYPGDDVRVRVDEIERANSLQSPVIKVGESLHLPA
jgi:nucleoid-associated protein YgaU